jgi:hypothetical protein
VTDPAKRIVPIEAMRFQRPSLRAGGLEFTWPVGTEGFRRSGTSTVALHKFIGDNSVHANVIHFDEGHIEMSGSLPGLSSPNDMIKLIDVLTNRNRKVLRVPGVFAREQYVEVETYDFTHSSDDRTHSIEYTISFVKVGGGDKVGGFMETALQDLKGIAATSGSRTVQGLLASPSSQAAQQESVPGETVSVSRPAKSRSTRYFTVIDGVDTFRMIAQQVYGDASFASTLVDLNQETIEKNNPGLDVNSYQLIYTRWPRGTKIAY